MVIIFQKFLMFHQVFLSPQVKRRVIISNKDVICKLPDKFSNNLRPRSLRN